MDWIRRLRLELLKGTPSHSLRACAEMANSFQPLARELFNAAFMSCWTSLTEQFQVYVMTRIVYDDNEELIWTFHDDTHMFFDTL